MPFEAASKIPHPQLLPLPYNKNVSKVKMGMIACMPNSSKSTHKHTYKLYIYIYIYMMQNLTCKIWYNKAIYK